MHLSQRVVMSQGRKHMMQAKQSVLKTLFAVAAIWGSGVGAYAQATPESAAAIVFENESFRYEIASDGRNLAFIDKASGTNYLKDAEPRRAANVQIAGAAVEVSRAVFGDGMLTLGFGDSGVEAGVRVAMHARHMLMEVASLKGEGVEQLTFLNVPLALEGSLTEPFACCVLALNLQTNVPEIPGPNNLLRAMCYPRFGIEGAQIAVIGCSQAQLRDVMKTVVSAAKDIPRSDIGGPWALDGEINRGSYLFDFGQCTEGTVDEWVAVVKRLGLNQVDFHTGGSLRFGDCRPNPALFPNGRASVKAVIDKLHAGGIAAGLHTYAFFIAKDAPYVTPVPDPRLGKDATFTLSEALAADAVSVPVEESTEEMSTTTGFIVRNSVTIQVGNELIVYAGVSKEPPYAFTQCTRGAYGTAAAAHDKGAKVHHLLECFGLFAPDPDSTLLAEVAGHTADTFNECGFDMIYLDALDGEDVLAGRENAWHYGSKFAFEIANRLNKPALFEMSTFHHHLWYIRARMGAWDHPNRSHKEFIDIHAAGNLSGGKTFLPMNLGWWAVKVWAGPQSEPTFPDDIEYLLAKCIGTDAGLSLMGVNPGNIDTIPAYQRLAPIFQRYEGLRHAGYFPQEVKDQLKQPGAEFTLRENAEGKPYFQHVNYAKHKVCDTQGITNVWTSTNPFGEQPLALRIEALMSAAPYDAPEAVVLEDFASPSETFTDFQAKQGVEGTLGRTTEQVKASEASGVFTATSSLAAPNGSWLKYGKTWSPVLNIAQQQGLGVWVHGDGQGQLLNIQMKSPFHITGGIGDHYVRVDFTGWRYFELIEPEGGTIDDWGWPYGGAYGIYREDVSYASIESLSLWYNNLPVGKPVTCYLSPIKALPLVNITLKNPSVTVGGNTITFPAEIPTGAYLEFHGMNDCKLYGPNGEFLADVTPAGTIPVLAAGANQVSFGCEGPAAPNPRARVTLITLGEPI